MEKKYFKKIAKIGWVGTLCASFLFLTCEAHQLKPTKKEDKFLIAQPVLNLYEECSRDSSYVSQGIYGESIYLIEKVSEEWALVETQDGYRGYALVKGILPDNPEWRTSKNLVKVASIAGMVYPVADTEKPALMRLPFGSKVVLLNDFNSNEDRWLEVAFANGEYGWMQRGDLEVLKLRTLEEMIALSHKFIELPYIWGGSSSEGFDSSGYIQTLYKQVGVLLPRDSSLQAISKDIIPLKFPEQPGDLVFFGKERIMHVGLYLGEGKFIHAGVRDGAPKVGISSLGGTKYSYSMVGKVKKIAYEADIFPITEDLHARMSYSWRSDNPVPLEDLRYIQLKHWGFDGCVHGGELVVHEKVAHEVVDIFRELFEAEYPIEKMLLIDSYHADDNLSCEDNNTSAFCSRPITGSATIWSDHSLGLAIDINPLLNPYKKGLNIVPTNGEVFLDRTIQCRGVINEEDICYQAFIKRGWQWGGHFSTCVDYQHFYKKF